jgi:hypothetical protein
MNEQSFTKMAETRQDAKSASLSVSMSACLEAIRKHRPDNTGAGDEGEPQQRINCQRADDRGKAAFPMRKKTRARGVAIRRARGLSRREV